MLQCGVHCFEYLLVAALCAEINLFHSSLLAVDLSLRVSLAEPSTRPNKLFDPQQKYRRC